MRAALYARFSSDLQSGRSLDDQLRICRELAARRGLAVADVFTDAALSGTTTHRPGLQALLAAGRAGQFQVLICEALDRLSRDLADVAALHRELTFLGVSIVTVEEGEVTPLHVGFKGTMNAAFVTQLASKIRRGQRGQVARGLSPGGLSYGYRVVKRLDDRGEPIRGLREIDPDQARVVRRIFADYVAGLSPIDIVARLNAEGIPAPRGRAWNASTVTGHGRRQNGILRNPLYVGRLLYNRLRMVKDPATGRRLSRDNAAAEVAAADAPALRIVDDATWAKAQARLALRAGAVQADAGGSKTRARRVKRQKYPLSGLVTCGTCGAAYIAHQKGRLRCSAYANKRTCANGRTVDRAEVEARVLGGLRAELERPEAVAEFVRRFHAAAAARDRRLQRAARDAAKRIADVTARIDRLVDAIADGRAEGGDVASMVERIKALEREKAALEAATGAAAAKNAAVVALHPDAGRMYREILADLAGALADGGPAAMARAREILGAMIEKVVVDPAPAGVAANGPASSRSVGLTLHGRLATLLAMGQGASKREQVGNGLSFMVVAGDRVQHEGWPAWRRAV